MLFFNRNNFLRKIKPKGKKNFASGYRIRRIKTVGIFVKNFHVSSKKIYNFNEYIYGNIVIFYRTQLWEIETNGKKKKKKERSVESTFVERVKEGEKLISNHMKWFKFFSFYHFYHMKVEVQKREREREIRSLLSINVFFFLILFYFLPRISIYFPRAHLYTAKRKRKKKRLKYSPLKILCRKIGRKKRNFHNGMKLLNFF